MQTRILTVLDDLMPYKAFICTSNCKLSAFEPRFQSRFQVFEISAPTDKEIGALLSDYIDPLNARQIATFAGGNVRQALLDAKGVLQQADPVPTPALATGA